MQERQNNLVMLFHYITFKHTQTHRMYILYNINIEGNTRSSRKIVKDLQIFRE